MGQYYRIVNIDKKQFLDPHRFGDGMKLTEFACSSGGILTGLAILLADGNNRGGGDLHCDDQIIGSWSGDRIVIAGDYADPGKHLTKSQVAKLKKQCPDLMPTLYAYAAENFADVSCQTILAMCADEYIREDFAAQYLDQMAADHKDNQAIAKAVSARYGVKFKTAAQHRAERDEAYAKRRAETLRGISDEIETSR